MTYLEERQCVWKGPEHWTQWLKSSPAKWQTPHTPLMLTSSPPEHCRHICFVLEGNSHFIVSIVSITKCHDFTWVLLPSASVEATTLLRVADGSAKKKEETLAASWREVELLCRASAACSCKTHNGLMAVQFTEQQTFKRFILNTTYIWNTTDTPFDAPRCISKYSILKYTASLSWPAASSLHLSQWH